MLNAPSIILVGRQAFVLQIILKLIEVVGIYYFNKILSFNSLNYFL